MAALVPNSLGKAGELQRIRCSAITVLSSTRGFSAEIGSAYGSRTRVPALRGLCPNH
jgi:hypothetical protein